MDIADIKTCRQALDVIDALLVELPEEESRNLYSVLTALRGPDSGEMADKKATTAIIRKVALPRAAAMPFSVFPATSTHLGLVTDDSEELCKHRVFFVPGGHFRSHAASAFAALELVWVKCNPSNPKTPPQPADQSASAVVQQQYDAAARDASVHNGPCDVFGRKKYPRD